LLQKGLIDVDWSFRDDAQHRTRNLEIPGSREDARPGMTMQYIGASVTPIEDVKVSTASSDDFGSARPALPAAARYAPLPCRRALPEIPPPVSAGFKPELS
jgi:hypothetical protein